MSRYMISMMNNAPVLSGNVDPCCAGLTLSYPYGEF